MFKIASPWIVLLLPLPFLVRWLLPAVKQQISSALKMPAFNAIQSMLSDKVTRPLGSRMNFFLALLAWCLLLLAVSGPEWLGKPIALPRSGRNIMLAIDLSGSMKIPDMKLHGQAVNRLQVIKAVAGKFIKQRVGDRIGLILFGTRAYLQTPLTFDRKTALAMMDDASIGLPGQRTAIGDAMGLAIKRLKKYPKQSRVLILLTDGQNNAGAVSPLTAAKVAANIGIRIYTIGLGSDRLLVPSFFGPRAVNPSAALDEKTLRQIAKRTGGLYFRAKDSQSLKRIYADLNQLEPVQSTKSVFRPVKPLYPWPLALALLLYILLIERSRVFR